MSIRNIALMGTLALINAGLTYLLVQFPQPALHWQQTLHQSRFILLTWRALLYGGLTIAWFTLTPRLQQHRPDQYQRLRKTALWSLALVTLAEISNHLQQETGL